MKKNKEIFWKIKENSAYICLVLKYLFAMLFPILAVLNHKMTGHYIIIALSEVIFIALITNLLYCRKKWLGYTFNALALLVMNVQFAVLYWGNTFISPVMLTNLDSVNAISGKFFVYGLSVVTVLLFSFLPVHSVQINRKLMHSLAVFMGTLYIGFVSSGMIEYSPYYSACTLYQQMERNKRAVDAMSNMENVEEIGQELEKNEFYSDSVSDYIQKPEDLIENPNVILIFVEGMSQNIIDDPQGLMTNVAKLQDKSISFTNYYNHTFATYMGLSGQLYSGYQRENYDENPLVSVQDVFKRNGYQTSMINTEPHNKEFSEYLANFHFDNLLTDEDRIDGMADSFSDKSAYEMLFETALEQNKDGIPFFLAMYSFGTHASLNGVHEKFSDEANALQNRFYDLNVQIGAFLKRFRNSELAENTVIVLTTDHATYQDSDFTAAFPDYTRENPTLDQIPLMIYYEGVTPKNYDVNGRNSLDMAPTILDFLDISGPNYFLGDSLFAEESKSICDTYFESVGSSYCTADGKINILSAEQQQEFEEQLIKYYALKLSDDLLYEEFEESAHVYARVNDDQTAIMTELRNAEEWDTIRYAVWSEESDQGDLKWFSTPGNHENCFEYVIDLSGFERDGVYCVHAYGSMEGSDELVFLEGTKVSVNRNPVEP